MLIKKIQQCSYVFDFSDPMAELRAKEIKRAALNEVLDYIANNKGVVTEPIYPEIIRMVGLLEYMYYLIYSNWQVRYNAFRALPPSENPDFDPEEDEPTLELSWPHLEVLYLILMYNNIIITFSL